MLLFSSHTVEVWRHNIYSCSFHEPLCRLCFFFLKGIWSYLFLVAFKRPSFPLFFGTCTSLCSSPSFFSSTHFLTTHFLFIFGGFSAMLLWASHFNLSCLTSTKLVVLLYGNRHKFTPMTSQYIFKPVCDVIMWLLEMSFTMNTSPKQ